MLPFLKARLGHPCWVFLFCCLLCLFSCGRWIVGGNPPNTPLTNYESFYQQVKDNYAFFEEKNIDWDSMDLAYRPLVHDSLSNDSLYGILSQMLFELQDGHVNLYVNNDRSRNADWYVDYPANFNQEFMHRTYWGKDYQVSGALLHTWLDSVGYVYYGSFSRSFNSKNMDYMLNRFADAKGLIIDVRSNGGGRLRNVYRWLERFVPEKTFMATIQHKNGRGKDDFSELDSIFVEPLVDYAQIAEQKAKAEQKAARKKAKRKKQKPEEKEEEARDSLPEKPKRIGAGQWATVDTTAMMLDKPIVVLTNRKSYSATNFFAGFMSTLPNVTLIGDRTGGGGGVPVSFELPNGWTFRLSGTRTYLSDGTDIENGIAPDIYQSTGPKEELEGVDAIVERAKALILEQ